MLHLLVSHAAALPRFWSAFCSGKPGVHQNENTVLAPFWVSEDPLWRPLGVWQAPGAQKATQRPSEDRQEWTSWLLECQPHETLVIFGSYDFFVFYRCCFVRSAFTFLNRGFCAVCWNTANNIRTQSRQSPPPIAPKDKISHSGAPLTSIKRQHITCWFF